MTYNVHSCVGMDGKLSPARIAKVIERFSPDIIALQEIDVGRARSEHLDQARAIANELEMVFHFSPAMHVKEERYGDAILSRYAMSLQKAGVLPRQVKRADVEPRGALWVEVDVGNGVKLQVINTHMGLERKERELQAESLLGKGWVKNPKCIGPIVVCGDFNATPRSKVCRMFKEVLVDAHSGEEDSSSLERYPLSVGNGSNTWHVQWPVCRIDHIFVSEGIKVIDSFVPHNELTRIASDHLPVIVDIELV
ncbi:MAG: endonuclease/exonuclease/phosphatase family protein [Deltaproteobacteria bacterium]|nr:endonuclease/exonuclease/phosphatase family protein [Deltaproteobacteria bacterium]